MFSSKKKIDLDKPRLEINYYKDGTLVINKALEKELIKSIKNKKLKEIELLNYSINNLSIQNTILDKMISEKHSMLESTKREFIDNLNRNVNPELLCQICFDNRINLILTPCGHTFCDKCFTDDMNICFNCRNTVQSIFKMYI